MPCPALDALGLRDEDGDWAPEEHGRSRDHTAWLLPAQGARSSRVEPTPAQRVKQKQIPGQPPHHTHTYTHTHIMHSSSLKREVCVDVVLEIIPSDFWEDTIAHTIKSDFFSPR